MKKNNTYTLITGASKGIGKAFAMECAKRNMNLVLIARNKELLVSLKDQLVNIYPIQVEYLAIDLLLENSCQ
jgi:short-subunit dehydrogenase